MVATRESTMIKAINLALREEMQRDDRVVVVGEGAGAGGLFGATLGLGDEFGSDRVLDGPPDEATLIGAACGLATSGRRPVVDIAFADLLWGAADVLANELATMRYRSGGQWSCPVVIRAASGAGTHGGPFHSQSPEAAFAHVPGLVVVMPADGEQARGLLKSAVRGDDPVLFLEPKRLYHGPVTEMPVDPESCIPLGVARIARTGDDVTVYSWGGAVEIALEAAEAAAEIGMEVEVVDLRTLSPLDEDTILNSARRTGRCVIVQEAPETGGVGAEIAALIASEAVDRLEAPIRRIAAPSTPVPFALEDAWRPTADQVLGAIEDVMDY